MFCGDRGFTKIWLQRKKNYYYNTLIKSLFLNKVLLISPDAVHV